MELEVLTKKAKNKEIKLEDLDVEDILKFLELGFLNPVLEEYFGLTLNEISRIRKHKHLTDADYENNFRNGLLVCEYIKNTYGIDDHNFLITILKLVIYGMDTARNTNYGAQKLEKIDWDNIDIDEEIKLRNIDREYRKNIVQEMIQKAKIDEACQQMILLQEERPFKLEKENKEEFIKAEFKVAGTKSKREVQIIGRSAKVKNQALKKAHYCCEINPLHETFRRRSDGTKFVVVHHLIPLEFQEFFPYSLDVVPNVVALCSNCHDEIRHGVNYQKLVKKLYEERKEDLEKVGIIIDDIEELYRMYERLD